MFSICNVVSISMLDKFKLNIYSSRQKRFFINNKLSNAGKNNLSIKSLNEFLSCYPGSEVDHYIWQDMLLSAVKYKNRAICDFAISKGAELNKLLIDLVSDYFRYKDKAEVLDLIKLTIEYGADPSATYLTELPLLKSLKDGLLYSDFTLVEFLIKNGATCKEYNSDSYRLRDIKKMIIFAREDKNQEHINFFKKYSYAFKPLDLESMAKNSKEAKKDQKNIESLMGIGTLIFGLGYLLS